MIHVVAFNISFVLCLAYSLAFGGKPERLTMFALAAADLFTISAINFLPRAAGFGTLAQALAIIDLLLLLSLTAIALRANRLWTIVLAGLQLSLVLVHASKALYPSLPAASYGIFAQFWAWPMIITSAIGTRNHRRRMEEFGEERDWKPLWPPSVHVRSSTSLSAS